MTTSMRQLYRTPTSNFFFHPLDFELPLGKVLVHDPNAALYVVLVGLDAPLDRTGRRGAAQLALKEFRVVLMLDLILFLGILLPVLVDLVGALLVSPCRVRHHLR